LHYSIGQPDQPVLSIAVPTYKRFDLLKETLNSIFALKFTVPFEVLVVDNDPEHSELALYEIEQYPSNAFSYYKNTENLGMYGNWNQCLALAKGTYITILHDDDLLLPEFSIQMNKLLANGTLAGEIVGYTIGMLDLRINKPSSSLTSSQRLKSLIKQYYGSTQTDSIERGIVDLFFANIFMGTLGVVMNRQMAQQIEGFNSSLYPIADYDFWCRWTIHFSSIRIINKTVGLYRLQQNESLRSEVRSGFVEKSTTLRRRLCSDNAVPVFFKYLVRMTAWVQQRSIYLDWRSKDEPDAFFFSVVVRRVWLTSIKMITILFHKQPKHRGVSQ
jgi:glycosyltransferase involved in cell wall biosynthesis